MVCRVLCEKGKYNSALDVMTCNDCSSIDSLCDSCQWRNNLVGGQLQCLTCGDVLRPNAAGTACEHKWCKTLNTANGLRTKCSVCKDDYYINFDNTQCNSECDLSKYQ
jgi:hypothetical protein